MPGSFTRVHYKPMATPRTRAASTIQAVVRKQQQRPNVKNLKLSKPVATLVQKRIEKANPTKYAFHHERRYQFSNLITQSPTTRINPVIPDIAQGVERNDRNGAALKLMNINIKGKIDVPADDNPPIGNEDRALIYVRMMVLSAKQNKLRSEIITDWTSEYNDHLFKNGATPTQPTGQYMDMLSSINRESFTVHHDRVFKLDRNYPFSYSPAPGDGATLQRPAAREFNFNLKCRNRQLKYEGPASVQSTNWQPFVVCLFAYGNGAAPSAFGVPFLEYMSKVTYKE